MPSGNPYSADAPKVPLNLVQPSFTVSKSWLRTRWLPLAGCLASLLAGEAGFAVWAYCSGLSLTHIYGAGTFYYLLFGMAFTVFVASRVQAASGATPWRKVALGPAGIELGLGRKQISISYRGIVSLMIVNHRRYAVTMVFVRDRRNPYVVSVLDSEHFVEQLASRTNVARPETKEAPSYVWYVSGAFLLFLAVLWGCMHGAFVFYM